MRIVPGKPAAVFVLVLGMASGLFVRPGLGAGVIFRYLPGQPALSSEVVAEGIETGPFLDVRELPARGPGGWGMTAPHSAEFEAPGSTIRSAAASAVNQPFGPRLTAEAWVRLAEVGGSRVLLSNRIGDGEGFTLGLEEGVPYLAFAVAGRTLRVQAAEAVGAFEYLWLAATARYDGGRQALVLSLYRDGVPAAEEEFTVALAGPYAIGRPFFVGTAATGGEPAAPVTEGALTGNLFAAVVRDYVAADAYLSSPVPLDGGPYLGLPDYHDYPLDVWHIPMDQRIIESPTPVRHRFFLPYVNDEYVPQGVATHVEAGGGDTTALVYVSYYHLTRSGQIESERSIVAELDAATGRVRRAFRLNGRLEYSHAGGIAFSHGALFVSSAGVLERYPLPPYAAGGPKYLDLQADPAGTIDVESRASFVSAYRDTLWVGDWRTPAHDAPYLYAYPLEADGRPSRTAQPRVFALPRNVQGVDFFEQGGTTYVFMSRNASMRDGTAELLRVRASELDRYAVPEADSVILLPYGIEDLSFFPDGTLWTNSESGADYYQRNETSPWTPFYPFVYGVSPARLFPGAVSTGAERPGGIGAALELEAYPSPARETFSVTFTLPDPGAVRLEVVDLLGRRVTTLLDAPLAAGEQRVRGDAARLAPGTYFVVLAHRGRRAVRPMTVIR